MFHSALVLSNTRHTKNELEPWLQHAASLAPALARHEIEFGLEFFAQRHNRNGYLPDNPPIEEVDDLLDRLTRDGLRLGSICIPLQLSTTHYTVGEEISTVHGWIDFASYAGIPLARLDLLDAEHLKKNDARETLSTILQYLNDSDLRSCIFSDQDQQSLVCEFVQDLNEELRQNTGCVYSAGQFDSSKPMPTIPKHVSVLSISISLYELLQANDKTYQSVKNYCLSSNFYTLLEIS